MTRRINRPYTAIQAIPVQIDGNGNYVENGPEMTVYTGKRPRKPRVKADLPQIKITLVKSTIGRLPVHRRTVAVLGLKRIGHSVVHYAYPSIRGMVNQVGYLLKVEPFESAEPIQPADIEAVAAPSSEADEAAPSSEADEVAPNSEESGEAPSSEESGEAPNSEGTV
jgi:large subunit ribosomal protein L30